MTIKISNTINKKWLNDDEYIEKTKNNNLKDVCKNTK
jgi:hypothetical protein